MPIETEGNMMSEARCYADGLEKRGKDCEPRNTALEAQKGQEMDSPLEPFGGNTLQTPLLWPGETNFDILNPKILGEKKCLLFQATKFVVISYGSNWKLTQSPLLIISQL